MDFERGKKGDAMRVKAIAIMVVLALSAGAFLLIRSEHRADAAAGDCYAETQGPATPTICG